MKQREHRTTSVTLVAALLFGSVAPAFAQGDNAVATDAGAADPPGLVGRVAQVQGTVSYHGQGATAWDAASVNFPVTSGSAVWTQPSAAAELDVGPTRIALDQSTEFDVDTLNDSVFTSVTPQGRLYLHVVGLQSGQEMQLRTPRGTVTIAQPGQYEITSGDTTAPTLVTVHSGLAQVVSPDFTLDVEPQQTAQVTGEEKFTGQIVPEVSDSFLTAQLALDLPAPQAVAAAQRYDAPPVVQNMTGYEAVASTGDWQPTPDYGQVWYPPVDPGWVPYRHGHWAFVAPWGWTWVDDASWGFAPFHYGRWVEIHDRWAWTPLVPGVEVGRRPVYAPALVAFVGLGVGVGIGASVGWIPLGPREVYRPPYRVSDTYIRNVNVTNVSNVTNITNVNNTKIVYMNNHAATVVPATAMTQSRGIAAQARPVNAATLATASTLARPPVQPTVATHGVTPGVAQALNLPRPVGAAPVVAARPGPPIRPVAVTPVGGAAAVGGRPAAALPPLAGSAAARAPVNAPATGTPSNGRPAIRPAGGLAAPAAGQPVPSAGGSALPRPATLGQPGATPRPAVQTPTPSPGAPRPASQPVVQPQSRPASPQPQVNTAPRPAPPPAPRPAPPPAPRPAPPPAPRPAPPPPPAPRPAPPPAPRPAPPAEHKVCPAGHPNC